MKQYEYTIKLYETSCHEVRVIARDEDDAIEKAFELDRTEYLLEWSDINDVEIEDRELVGQW